MWRLQKNNEVKMSENKGYRIWEIQKNMVPKEINSGSLDDIETFNETLDKFDLDNKTYAIRIGKDGLK